MEAMTKVATKYIPDWAAASLFADRRIDSSDLDGSTIEGYLPRTTSNSTDGGGGAGGGENEQSWYNIDHKELLTENSTIAESMYLELNSPAAFLCRGERVVSKSHATTARNQQLDLYSVEGGVAGTLFVTTFRLFFNSFDTNKFSLEVPLACIASVSEVASERSDVVHILEVKCKDFRVYRFGFPYDCTGNPAFNDLRYLRGLSDTPLSQQFAFASYNGPVNPHVDGWLIYDFETEMRRQGIKFDAASPSWRISTVNVTTDFENPRSMICSTYPQLMVVPYDISDKELKIVASFRSRGRIPTISYVHPNGASLSRSAQPLVGLTRSRCSTDEKLLKSLRLASAAAELHIFDCRSYAAAFANGAVGGGFENTSYYENVKVTFLNMENIHAIRDGFRRLFDLCRSVVYSSEGINWLIELESTHWLDHIKSLLAASNECATLIDAGHPVLCHCSDGWDRTAQVSALTQILLDPYFRTMKGFAVLVEKEFCEFGHMFRSRLGETGPSNFFENDQMSPIFLQFVDCVSQLLREFPCEFEFNGNFLISLLDYLYSGKVGTFMGNSDLERRASKVKDNTTSVWTFLLTREEYKNPLFSERVVYDSSTRVLKSTVHPSGVSLWTQYYFRYVDANVGRCNFEADKAVRALQAEKTRYAAKCEKMEESYRKTVYRLRKQKEENERLEAELRALMKRKVLKKKGNSIVMEETEDTVLLSVSPNGDSGSEGRSYSSPIMHSRKGSGK